MSNLGEVLCEKVEQKTRIDDILNIMKSLKLSAEEAICAIGVPDEDRQSLLEILNDKLAEKISG